MSKPKPKTTIARFDSLPRALEEARKYGVTATLPTVQYAITTHGVFTHYFSATRLLSLSRAQGRKQWKLSIDVRGRVVTANVSATAVPVVGALKTAPLTSMQQAFVEAVGAEL